MDNHSEGIHPLDINRMPELIAITELQALEYVSQLLEHLIALHEQAQAQAPEHIDMHRKESYDQALEGSDAVLNQIVPQPNFQEASTIAQQNVSHENSKEKAKELYKRFWLKEPPPISIRDYLHRFHRYCCSSAATYLTTGSLIHHVAVQLKVMPVTRRNAYRLFSAAFVISAKFIEDKLYPMSRYATTAGLKKPELARLELSFLLVINFNIRADREVLKESIYTWALLNEASTN